MSDFWVTYGEASKTAVGFFWKAGWAFVLGYTISAMIQVFVPKKRLTQKMGDANVSSISMSTVFGTISSSCSFAALSAARSLVQKGAHFICAVAFMFASTNLVIELGILIFIFLGWQFLVAEIIGGLVLIIISSFLIRLTYPKAWLESARKKVEDESEAEADDFDWRKRIKSREGWSMVGQKFVMEWQMVWREILIGFTVAGFVAVFVPDAFWKTIFLAEAANNDSGNFLIALQNAAVAPFVAAATFIGSMGNIPLATVLNSGGVMFTGIMGFIYSDLMVPPLVKVNAKYYGWRVALYIAGIMYLSIVTTALILHYLFFFTGLTPESSRRIDAVTQFSIDYSFFLNLLAAGITSYMIYLHQLRKKHQSKDHHHGSQSLSLQTVITYLFIVVLLVGLVSFAITQ
jgi:uncharacterized membrane protein YraQ (UPF0718 family)